MHKILDSAPAPPRMRKRRRRRRRRKREKWIWRRKDQVSDVIERREKINQLMVGRKRRKR